MPTPLSIPSAHLSQDVVPETSPTVSASPERKKWTPAIPAAIGAVGLGVALSAYGLLRPTANTEAASSTPHTPTHSKEPSLKPSKELLYYYMREAEQALSLASVYINEGNTDKLRMCLSKLKQWKAMHIEMNGVPHFTQTDGLVITRSPDETIEKDRWERMNKGIQHLCQILNQTDDDMSADVEQ